MKMPNMTVSNSLAHSRQNYPAISLIPNIQPQRQERGSYIFSQNNHYAIKPEQARTLYVSVGQAGPPPNDFFKRDEPNIFIDTVTGKPTTQGKLNAVEYKRYAPKATFIDNKPVRYADFVSHQLPRPSQVTQQ